MDKCIIILSHTVADSSPSATISPTPTPIPTNSITSTGDRVTWIASVSGIILGILLIELGLVLMVVLCRKRQIRKERLLREHLYYTIGDRPPNPVAAAADTSSNEQPIMLTNYVNLPQVEPAATKPVDIPGTARNVSDTITNSAYSGGIHYDRIPGEPDSKPASVASEHVYSVIKDEAAAKKQSAAQQPTQKRKQKKHSESASKDKEEAERDTKGTGMPGAMAQPVDMEGDGFIELLPRNMQAYDSLKREGHQEIQELSIVLTSGTYDQLCSPEEEPTNKKGEKGYIFNPYSGESDTESPTLLEDLNPYDDTVGVKSQLSSLQVITSGQNPESRDKNAPSARSSGKLNKKPVSLEVDESSGDMAHAYDAIDELQKQIHILSQSIPTLDLYGYEDLDKIKPAPKASRSIPVLDVAGYEDLDAAKPAQKQAVPKSQMNYSDLGFDSHFYESITEKRAGRHSLGAVLDVDESPPSIPARTIESMYTVVQKKPKSSTLAAHAAKKENKAKKLEDLYSTSKKSSSTTDLFEAPPPVPPLTVEALYTAVQKPKKRPTAKSGATLGEGGSPPLPPKGDIVGNAPTVPPKTVASMYTAVQKRPKATVKKATGTEAPTFEFEPVPPPIPPKSVEEAYLAAQKEGKIPPIPPRAHERVYSGVYRHKEEKQTVL